MTLEEQNKIVGILQALSDFRAFELSKRVKEWAEKQFSEGDKKPSMGSRGVAVQYRVAAIDDWQNLKYISFPEFSSESSYEKRSRGETIKNLFYWPNLETSNRLGDVTAVRFMPYINVDNVYRLKEDEARVIECTDNKERREWNHLDFRIYTQPSQGVRDYYIVRDDIHKGDNINWYESWHFSLADEEECPVAPIVVEKVDDFELVLRYRDRLFTLSMEPGKTHSVHLEEDVPVKPTHNWNSIWLRPPYTFTLVADLTWQAKLYGSMDRDLLHNKPHLVRTSDLPPDVRTREQIDHDAWEEAVRSGAIN